MPIISTAFTFCINFTFGINETKSALVALFCCTWRLLMPLSPALNSSQLLMLRFGRHRELSELMLVLEVSSLTESSEFILFRRGGSGVYKKSLHL